MKGKQWLVLLVSLTVVLLANNIGITRSSFVDLESSSGNSFQAWASTQWVQTTQAHFDAGVLNNVNTSASPGDVKLDATSSSVTDTFNDETKIASKSNLVVASGQVKLTQSSPTESLYPNGAGDDTDINNQYPNSGAHWEKVDEASADDFSTYVYTNSIGWDRDLYNIQNHSGRLGTITAVTVYFRFAGDRIWLIIWIPTPAYARAAIKTGGTVYTGSTEYHLGYSFVTESYQWTTNPKTGLAWTWDDINALQAGIELHSELLEAGLGSAHCTQVYVVVSYNQYASPGTLTSTNLLSGKTVGLIDSFGYNASAIPSGTSLKVRFSQDNTNWYNSAGTLGGWDTCSQGTHTIDLSGLGWSGANFYYQMEFTSDGIGTPVLDEISVNYSVYYSSGTLASQVLDTGVSGARWDALFWDETLQSNTDITFAVRASDTSFLKDAGTPSWTSVGGTSPVTSGLPSGRYMQWRATLTSSAVSKTPVLQEVRVYHY